MNRLSEDTLPDTAVELPALGVRSPWHVFDRESVLAVNTALDCARPLLVRGSPGTGKSQLARAVAQTLERVFLSRVVDARTDPHELRWEYDALARLADAQVHAPAGRRRASEKLARAKYTRPGPLWWALNWTSAKAQAAQASVTEPTSRGGKPENGVVLLIDEIDKADMSVPNGLLECLGHGCFSVPGIDKDVEACEPAPLILLTTNTDRVLPDAFVRRCVVLHMRVPPEEELVAWLVRRGKAHFPTLSQDVLQRAAELLRDDRRKVGKRTVYAPGLAEYIDLLTAATRPDVEGAMGRIDEITRFMFAKHVDPGQMQ